MMKKACILFIMVSCAKLFCQNPEMFHTYFGSDNEDVGMSIVQSLRKGYVLCGQTFGYGASQSDMLLVKTDTMGIPVWIKTHGGFGVDIGKYVAELPDSSIVMIGYSNSFGNGGYDALIIKTDKDGNLLWRRTYGGSDWDFGNSIKLTNDGNLIICGSTYSYGRGDKDGFIAKMDFNGNFLWSKVYGGKKEDVLNRIIPTSDGGYIAAGTTKSYGDSLGDMWVAKFNATGDSTWFSFVGGNKMEVGNSIAQDVNGDYLICGGSETYSKGMEDGYIVKLANNNTFVWQKNYGEINQDEEAYEVVNSQSTHGSMVITMRYNYNQGTKLDFYTIALDFGGDYVNGGTFGGLEDEVSLSVANTKDKGYIVVGYTESFNAKSKDVFLVKCDSNLTIGPLIISVPEFQENNSANLFPTVIDEGYFFITLKDGFPDRTEIKVYDVTGKEIENLEIDVINNHLVKVTLPSSVKGLILVSDNKSGITRKCLVR